MWVYIYAIKGTGSSQWSYFGDGGKHKVIFNICYFAFLSSHRARCNAATSYSFLPILQIRHHRSTWEVSSERELRLNALDASEGWWKGDALLGSSKDIQLLSGGAACVSAASMSGSASGSNDGCCSICGTERLLLCLQGAIYDLDQNRQGLLRCVLTITHQHCATLACVLAPRQLLAGV